MNTIVRMLFGSHLYGTSNPNSDKDYKGIFMPTSHEIILGRIPKCLTFNTKKDSNAKNSKDDVDEQYYSLHYFIEMASRGETCALDMLHAPENCILECSPVWKALQENRSKFYTRNLQAFVGYARTQAAKYGVKGSRLSDCKKVLDFVSALPAHLRMIEVWDELPMGEHISKSPGQGVSLYTVCGRSIQSTCKLDKAVMILSKYYENYGARAKLAEQNEGIDWKAVSHALRAAFQVKEILTTGDLKFPLKDAEYLKLIKAQSHPETAPQILSYKNFVGPQLEAMMEELEALVRVSILPEKVDSKFWDDFVLEHVGVYLWKANR